MFSNRARTYLIGAHRRAPLKGRLLALSTNIRLGWKSMSGTNTINIGAIHTLQRKQSVMIASPRTPNKMLNALKKTCVIQLGH